MKLKQILAEKYYSINTVSDKIGFLANARTAAKEMRNTDLLWRGFNMKSPTNQRGYIPAGGIFMVENKRSAFYGKVDRTQEVINGLSLNYVPIFASFEKSVAKNFGNPFIVIPANPVFYQNKDVDDLFGADKDIPVKDIIDGYINQISPGVADEVIIDAEEYYLLSPEYINKLLPTKLQLSQINSYNDVVDLLGKYLWLQKQRKNK